MSEILSPNKHVGRRQLIRLIVIHTMEVPESDVNVAESVGHYFARPATKASAHVGVDTNSECRYVADKDTAWAAPGANADGLQLELAGRAGQTTGNWSDVDSKAILERAAQRTASWCRTHNIPAKRLTNTQLASGARGIVGHVQVSAVYKRSSHWDPGPNFPWVSFLARVNVLLARPATTAPSRATVRKPVVKPFPLPAGHWYGMRSSDDRNHSGYDADDRAAIKAIQVKVHVTPSGAYDLNTRNHVITAQKAARITADGRVGPQTWAALKP